MKKIKEAIQTVVSFAILIMILKGCAYLTGDKELKAHIKKQFEFATRKNSSNVINMSIEDYLTRLEELKKHRDKSKNNEENMPEADSIPNKIVIENVEDFLNYKSLTKNHI